MENPSPATARGADTRQEIIRAAHDLFIRKGYHGTSMRQIARSAGIALGGIYNHFDGKETIFTEVLLAYHPYHEILPALANKNFDNFESLVRSAAAAINSAYTNQPDLIHLMFIEMVEFNNRHIPDLLDQILPHVSGIFSAFNSKDARLKHVPIPVILRTFIGAVLGYFLTSNALGHDGPEAFRRVTLDQFLDIYLYGILNTEASP